MALKVKHDKVAYCHNGRKLQYIRVFADSAIGLHTSCRLQCCESLEISVCVKNFPYLHYLHYIRLSTVCAVDETRVELTDKSEVGTKYINASFIDVSL